MKKILTILMMVFIASSYGASITWTRGGGNNLWSNSANWSGSQVPTSSDDVTIPAIEGTNYTVTILSGTSAVCNSLTIESIVADYETTFADAVNLLVIATSSTLSVTNDLNLNGGNSKFRIVSGSSTISGNVNINDANEFNIYASQSLTVSGNLVRTSGSITLNGTVNVAGSFPSSGVTCGGSSTVVYTSTQTISPITYQNLTFSGVGKKTINGNVTVNGTFTPGTGEVEYNFASTTTIIPASYGTLTFTGGGEKQIAGTVSATTFNIGTGKVTYLGASQTILPAVYPNLALDGSGTHVIAGTVSATIFSNSGSSVSYTGAATQNVIPGTYAANLTFSGAGKKVFTDVTTITGTFTPGPNEVEFNSSSTVTVKPGTYGTLSLTGTGTKNMPDGVSFTTSNLGTNQSVSYTGTNQSVLAGAYNVLTFSASGTKTISGAVTASSFNPSTSTVSYDGASAQTIMATTYTTLSFSGAGQKNIVGTVSATTVNANSATISISGTFTPTTFNQGTSTVNYSAAGDQSVTSGITYYNLTVSGSGNKTVGSALSVNNLTTSGTAVLVTGTNNITVAGNFTNGGSFTKTSGDVSVTGNFANNGTFTLNDGILKFLGSSATAFSGSTAITAKYVEATKTSNTLTLSNTLNIDVSGTFTITNTTTTVAAGGNLVLKATSASNYAIIPAIPTGSSITGNVTAEAFIPATIRTWWHLSNPVSAVPVSAWQDDFKITGSFTGADVISGSTNAPSMYRYNETHTSTNADSGWVKVPTSTNTETMTAGLGYRAFIRDGLSTVSTKTLDVSGSLNQGAINIPITYTNTGSADSDGWNFIGNPYPATLDWTSLSVDSDLNDANAYVWNAISKSYTFSTSIKIAPFQGFWVQAASSGNLNLIESYKNVGGVLQRPTVVENKINIYLLDKNVDNSYNNSSASIVIHSDATNGFDKDFEASYLSRNFLSGFGDEKLADVATVLGNGKKLKVNYIPESENVQLVPLHVVFGTSKSYSLTLTTEEFNYGGDLVLIDSYLGKETMFTSELRYDFATNADAKSTASDRFKVRVGAKPVGVFSSVDNNSTVSLYPNPAVNQVNIKVISASSNVVIDVVDALGNKVYNESINNSLSSFEKSIDVSNFTSGMYFVNITQNGKAETLKFIIK